MKKIVIVAGDKSGDLYGGLLAKKLKAQEGQFEIYSFGGEKLAKHSKQVINLIKHSVTGLIEVLKSLPKIIETFNQTVKEIDKIEPDLVILIDFPDFNLRLAQKFNRKYPLYYYVSPQVWAWRKERINIIRRFVDEMVVIFKFEEEFYKNEHIGVRYFGHPLLEIIENKPTKAKDIVSFLPGSRKNVLKHHLPIVRKTYDILKTKLPWHKFRIIRPENIDESFYEKFSAGMEIVPYSQDALRESKFVIASSGTATVEVALMQIPYLLIYKMNNLSYWLVKKMVKTQYAAMVNILAGKPIIKELLQEKAMPLHIAHETLAILNDPKAYNDLKQELSKIRSLLEPENATDNFVNHINKLLSCQI